MASPDPMEELLRARLKRPVGWTLGIKALLRAMYGVDSLSRLTTGQAFFALRESKRVLEHLDGRVGDALIKEVLAMNGGTDIVAKGLEHVPKTGAILVGATHPIGTFDFLAHAGALLDHRPDLKVVAGRETERFLGAERVISVDFNTRFQAQNVRDLRRAMIAHLENKGALLIFGSGKVPDMADGLLFEPPWKSGLTNISAATGVAVIPASANMRNSRHYYRTRRWARWMSGNNAIFGREVASLRYSSELLAKLGGRYEVIYGPQLPAGSPPDALQTAAEALVPGLYVPAA